QDERHHLLDIAGFPRGRVFLITFGRMSAHGVITLDCELASERRDAVPRASPSQTIETHALSGKGPLQRQGPLSPGAETEGFEPLASCPRMAPIRITSGGSGAWHDRFSLLILDLGAQGGREVRDGPRRRVSLDDSAPSHGSLRSPAEASHRNRDS